MSVDSAAGTARTQEAADAPAHRRDRPAPVRGARLRARHGGGGRPGRRGVRADGLQLLPHQGGPGLLAPAVVRGRAARDDPRARARRAGARRLRPLHPRPARPAGQARPRGPRRAGRAHADDQQESRLLAREQQIFASYTASLAALLAEETTADAADVRPWVAATRSWACTPRPWTTPASGSGRRARAIPSSHARSTRAPRRRSRGSARASRMNAVKG